MTTEELLSRGVVNIISNRESLEKLLTDRTVNVYLGIDPTATKIHLGHAVSLRKLQAFADIGHTVTFLIGDFTSLIGDTSDKESERPVLTSEQIQENFKTYKEQAQKLLDFSKITVRHNSEWLSKLTFAEIIGLCQHFSFGDFASRELIKKRLTDGKRVGLHEALYPVMQGYDSYILDTDLQIGGADQTFNMMAGRILQKDKRNKDSFVLTTDYLLGTDGRKMSKTWGNAIWLDDTPSDMFGKVMSLRDDLIVPYFTLATSVSAEQIEEVQKRLTGNENPMTLKKELAHTIVAELHTPDEADSARNDFESVFQQRDVTVAVKQVQVPTTSPITITDLILKVGMTDSKTEAKRLIEQGAVEYDGTVIKDPTQTVEVVTGKILKIGKRNFFEIQ